MIDAGALKSLLPVLAVLAVLAIAPALHPSNRILSPAITAMINVVALYGLAVLFAPTGCAPYARTRSLPPRSASTADCTRSARPR